MNISVIAEAGGGKDFLAEHLSKKYGYTRYAFADNVRLVAETWFPDLYGDGKEKPRWLLQAIGTKFREIDPDVWIKAMFNDIDSNRKTREFHAFAQELVVVTDCRMPNEYEALKERGYTFIRVKVDEDIRRERLINRGDKFSENDLKHHTESFYDSFESDHEVWNNGTPENVYNSIDIIIQEMMKK